MEHPVTYEERRKWRAADAEEVRRDYPSEAKGDADDDLAANLARHFGYQVREGMPAEGDYYGPNPGCVTGFWYRDHDGCPWSCLRCASYYTFQSRMADDWLERFKRGEFVHC